MRFQLATLVGGSSVTIHCHAATARLTREYQSEYRRLPLTSVATCGPPLDTNVHISSNGRSQLASPLTRPAAEEVGPQQTHHELAVLIPHLAAPPNDAHGGPAARRASFHYLHLSAEPVAGPDRQRPAKLLDAGRAEADRFGHQVLHQQAHEE